jgi:hypothetical protein
MPISAAMPKNEMQPVLPETGFYLIRCQYHSFNNNKIFLIISFIEDLTCYSPV